MFGKFVLDMSTPYLAALATAFVAYIVIGLSTGRCQAQDGDGALAGRACSGRTPAIADFEEPADILWLRPLGSRYLMRDRLAWHELTRIRETHRFDKNEWEVER